MVQLNQQQLLFSENSPLPPRNLIDELKNEVAAIEEAANFAGQMLWHRLASDGELSLSVETFIKILTDKFGYGVRLHLFDIAEILRRDDSIGSYARSHLTVEALQDALRGKDEKQKTTNENTLDELFARSLELRTSTKLIEAMNFVAKIKKYSPYNNMLVFLQRPNATYWATASHWEKALGRKVKQDAVPIIMLQPMSPVMLVYDVIDTEGKPLPKGIGDIFAVEGELDGKIYPRTLENCQRIGLFVRDVELESGLAGMAIRNSSNSDFKLSIEINQKHETKTKYATLCHELAHIFLGHLGGDPSGKEWFSRVGLTKNQRELEAEAVAYLVCFRAGLISRSADYLSLYLEDDKDIGKISIELIMKTAGKIEEMGKRLLNSKESNSDSKK